MPAKNTILYQQRYSRMLYGLIKYKIKTRTDFVNSDSSNHGELDGHGKCTIFRVTVYLFELAFDTVIVE